jgi:hypothetical protein
VRELFVYYRVDARHATQAMGIVSSWQRELRAAHAQLLVRLLKRPVADAESKETWMEAYAMASGAPDVADALLAELSAGPASLSRLIDGPRHAEVFIACAS